MVMGDVSLILGVGVITSRCFCDICPVLGGLSCGRSLRDAMSNACLNVVGGTDRMRIGWGGERGEGRDGWLCHVRVSQLDIILHP